MLKDWKTSLKMSGLKSLFVQLIGKKAERPTCTDAHPQTKHLGSVRELFSLADKGVKRSNGWKSDKFGLHVAKAMNCLRNKQGERGGGLTS